MKERVSYYAREVAVYWRATASLRDFMRLIRVRVALSKGVGRIVCPRPTVISVDVPQLGGRVWLRTHTSDIGVLSEQLVGGVYDAVEAHPGSVETVVDLGANTGLVARWLLARFPAARIVCVEPEPGNAAMLRRNLAPFADRAAIVVKCIAAHEGRATLATTSGEWGFAMSDDGTGVDVEVTTMERVIAEQDIGTIDLLKCDVEGAERDLFADSAAWIGRVRFAVVECHGFPGPELLPGWQILDHHTNPAYATETVVIVPPDREPALAT